MRSLPPGLTRDEAGALGGWAAWIAATLLAFWLSEGTPYHQLSIGLLLSSATLFVLMLLFEVLWRAITGERSRQAGTESADRKS